MQREFRGLVRHGPEAAKRISLLSRHEINKVPASSWPLHNWTRGDLLALAGVVTAIVVAIVPPLRRYIIRKFQALLLRAGLPRRQYAKWFVEQWGLYDNPYLDDIESLNLSNTFVPLSFRSEQSEQEVLSIATAVLGSWDAGNLIIEGAPGSGKSTLMKAYGVGVFEKHRNLLRSPGVVPFLVQLRKLSRALESTSCLADYLVDEILVSGAGMTPGRAANFLRYSLERRQVLVMLDGLDEVAASRYQVVLEAVYEFVKDRRPDCPTHLARTVITCRRQNFISIRDEWVPAIAGRVCSLAPLRNSEIFSYLNKHRAKFKAADGPESFIQAVRASGTLDLHRIPLILAMSVGLYARKDYFEIPSSIAKLYEAMIEEMLDRHRFKRDPGGGALIFHVGDKFRYLREFALHAARKQQGFEEFSKASMMDFGRSLAPHLDAVKDPQEFVDEIILRSGLVTDVAENGVYVFAHRSIQEYLAADELRLTDDGDLVLLDKAADPEWRQVTQFYAAGLEQRKVDPFLRRLSQVNPTLAGYCLASAKPSDEVAAVVLKSLEPVDGERLASLTAATMSARLSVQEMSIQQLKTVLSSSLRPPVVTISGDVEGMLPLLNSLAGTNAAEIAALVPDIILHVPDDPRLVEPLWRCLAARGIEHLPASRAIVERLLDLSMDPNAFEELARQDAYTRDFITEQVRRRAYPFTDGLPLEHNMVTLLAWAEYLGVAPKEPNRFFQAKAAARLSRVEVDKKRSISFSPFWPARILSSIMLIAAVSGAVVVLSDPMMRQQLGQPFGWLTLFLILGAPVIVTVGYFTIDEYIIDRFPASSWVKKYVKQSEGEGRDDGNIVSSFVNSLPNGWRIVVAGILLPDTFGIACAPLLAHSWRIFVVTVCVALPVFFGLATNMFTRGFSYQIYRASQYVDVYDDDRSRHWVRRGSREKEVHKLAEATNPR